jgi:hypothetical protein
MGDPFNDSPRFMRRNGAPLCRISATNTWTPLQQIDPGLPNRRGERPIPRDPFQDTTSPSERMGKPVYRFAVGKRGTGERNGTCALMCRECP